MIKTMMFGIVRFSTYWKRTCWRQSCSRWLTTSQHKRDMESYQAYKPKDRVARILMLSSMRNDLMPRFENNISAMSI